MRTRNVQKFALTREREVGCAGGELFTVNSEPSPWLHYCCARHGELDVQLRLDFPGKRDMTLSTDAAARSWGTLATLRLFIAKRWHCDSGRGVDFFFPEHLHDQEWKLIGPTVLSNVYAGLHRYRELPLENMPDAMRRRVLQHELPSWHQLVRASADCCRLSIGACSFSTDLSRESCSSIHRLPHPRAMFVTHAAFKLQSPPPYGQDEIAK